MKNHFLKFGFMLAFSFTLIVFNACNGDKPTLSDNSLIVARNIIAVNGSTDEIVSVRALAADWNSQIIMTSIAETNFQNNGFSLQLPKSLADKFLIPVITAYSSATITGNKDAKWGLIELVASDEKGGMIGSFNLAGGVDLENRTGTIARWYYVDSDITIKGEFQLVGGPTTKAIVNLTLKKGWNIVYYSTTVENNIAVLKTTTQRPSGILIWTYAAWDDIPLPMHFSLNSLFDR